jgi:hypothetical protein
MLCQSNFIKDTGVARQLECAGTRTGHQLTRSFRGAACGRWPPRAVKSVSVKGGGQPSAALTVGSRAVGKRKTLSATSPGQRKQIGEVNRSRKRHPTPCSSWLRLKESAAARPCTRFASSRLLCLRFWERAARALRVRRLDRSTTATASWMARTFAAVAGVASPRLRHLTHGYCGAALERRWSPRAVKGNAREGR